MGTAAARYQITRSRRRLSFPRSDRVGASLEDGIAFLTKRAEENGFVVLSAEIEDGAATVATAKPKTFLMNIYEIAEA